MELKTNTIIYSNVAFTRSEIFSVVDDFYSKVQVDQMLSVPFQNVNDWADHVDRLTHFWWVRFGGEPYLKVSYNPVIKHFEAGFNDIFLNRWIKLFQEVLVSHLNPEQVEVWLQLVVRMGNSLSARNEMLKQEFDKS